MAIYVLFEGIGGQSGLAEPFGSDWCKVDSLSWGVDRVPSGTARPGAPEVRPAAATLRNVNLRKPADGASSEIFRKALAGTPLGAVALAITDGAGNKTVRALKLDNAVIASVELVGDGSSAGQEQLVLAYSKIALAVLLPTGLQLATWDIAANKPWADAARAFTVDTRWGIKVKLSAG